MNDTTPMKEKRSLLLPIVIGIVLIAVLGFLASRAGLDKALVKQVVDNFIANTKEKAAARGRDVAITYGDLSVVGNFADKHVVIHDPVLTIKPLERTAQPGQVDAVRITTPTLAIYPLAKDLSSLKIELAQPIDVAGEDEPTKSLLKITSSSPVQVTVTNKKLGEVPYVDVAYSSPTLTTFTYLREQQATGAEEETPTVVPVYQDLKMAVADGSGFSSSFAQDGSGVGKSELNVRDVMLTPVAAPEGAVKIAEIVGMWSNTLNEKKLNALQASLVFGPLTSDNAQVPYLPVKFEAEATYTGPLQRSSGAVVQAQGDEASMELKKFTLTTKDASLNATANFTASASDVLPVGTANVALSNAQFVFGEMRKHGILNDASEPMLKDTLKLITGQPYEEIKDLVVPVERIRGGSFKIGNATFEELMALVFKQVIQMKTTPAAPATPVEGKPLPPQSFVPQLPSPNKPKAEPIEVNDLSVRG